MKVHDLLDPASDSLLLALKKRREREAQRAKPRRWLARLRAIGAAVVRWHLWEPKWSTKGQPGAEAPSQASELDCQNGQPNRIGSQLDAREVLALARGAALRAGEAQLATVLHAVLLLDLMGSLDDVSASCNRVLASVGRELARESGRVH